MSSKEYGNSEAPLPDSVHGNEYWDNLPKLRDAALTESHILGRRWHLGSMVRFGVAQAEWQSANGGITHLEERGLRVGSTAVGSLYPTEMHMFQTYDSGDTELTTFRMDVDDIGDVQVSQTILSGNILANVIRNRLAVYSERRYALTEPTDEQLMRVYTEMQRGASGEHTLQ